MIRECDVRGNLDYDTPLAPFTWFRVGGNADMVFRPADIQDLSHFLKNLPQEIPVTILGAGSNIIIRDGGIRGAVIRLGKGFSETVRLNETDVRFGACVPDMNAAKFLADHALEGGAFLRGVPGTIGGAVFMNAGSYGAELKDIFVSAEGVMRDGTIKTFTLEEMGFTYRHSAPENIIYTSVILRLRAGDKAKIHAEMEEITQKRSQTQPIKSRTGGSTFKNPVDAKAWELIDKAGCRGLTVGDAQMSELHCNFMLNLGQATAYDLESLGEMVREKVYHHSGHVLEWEIKRIGEFGDEKGVRVFG